MRHHGIGVLAALFLVTAAHAAPPDAELMAPINRFNDSFNTGDTTAAMATHVASADLFIVDEIPPYLWQGRDALRAWSAALNGHAEREGMTEQAVTIGPPTRQEMEGDRAYVVVPAVYSFKQRGTAMREAAQWTFVLKKGAEGWLINGWTWAGPKPAATKP